MAISNNFVSLSNIVSEVLLRIGDSEEKKYYALALQFTLNAIRNANVHYVKSYEEVPVTIGEDLGDFDWPQDCVKPISVGTYKHGEFWSFTRKPDMAKTHTGDGDTYDSDIGEGEDIPIKGVRFGATGFNFAYWTESEKECKIYVRNYTGTKAILRYRSNGINCNADTCVPYLVRDLIISMVVYEFALMGIPRRFAGMELQLKQMERSRHFDEFTDMEYIPQNLDEFMDSQFESYNVTVRRG